MGRVIIDGGLDAPTIRLEGDIGSRAVRLIVRTTATEWIGLRIERSFAREPAGNDARRATRGVAADAVELAGLLRPAIDLATLKKYA
ncbi:hypothetical protein [Bradyrhizobium roseum]|uniref:hypothetical protein n=1 Tax=Bradyrhizobium roseum TaxID=3056648 RepID=UPI002618D5E3|nr:hypothetical protein [Bradyrhizobium roseus]WKA25662.1 hypothetical protein QUH67_18710 [Bradyrhizobium roseus]